MKRHFRIHPITRSAAMGLLLGASVAASAQTPMPTTSGGQKGVNQLINGKKITLPPIGTLTQPLGTSPAYTRGAGSTPFIPNIGSHAANMIATPDGKFAIATDLGFREYLSAVDTTTGALVSQIGYGGNGSSTGLFYGLAFNPVKNSDNTWTLYAAQGSYHVTSGTTKSTAIAVVKVDATTGTLTAGTPLSINTVASDFTAGLALSADGQYLYVVNHQATATNMPGSLIVVSLATGVQVGRFDFTKANGITKAVTIPQTTYTKVDGTQATYTNAGTASNFPYAIAVSGATAYVASTQDATVYALNVAAPTAPTLAAQIAVGATAYATPMGLLVTGGTLYVANAHDDSISVVNTATNAVTATIDLRPAGAKSVSGVTPNQMTVSPDGKTLYAALSDMNAVALIDTTTLKIKGEIPVGWYPTAVVASTDGKRILVSNARGTSTRYPNPGQTVNKAVVDNAQYSLNQIEADVETINVPTALKLTQYTQQVLSNNLITPNTDSKTNNPLYAISKASGGITHVIYIIRENRTYDQVLGDLNTPAEGNRGNGDPTLTLFPRPTTPNTHAIVDRFALLDNFYDVGDASMEGWDWSTSAINSEHNVRNQPYNYSGRGANYDSEGTVNNYEANGLPAGATDQNNNPLPALPPLASDLATGVNGRISDTILKAGNTVRNYGNLLNHTYNGSVYPAVASLQPGNHYDGSAVFSPALFGNTDLDFAGYGTGIAESPAPWMYAAQSGAAASVLKYLPTGNNAKYGQYTKTYTIGGVPTFGYDRYSEWKREFDLMLLNDPTGASVPNFEMVRFGRNHTAGINAGSSSAKAQIADNDYAVGLLVDAISHSPIWAHTAIFVLEDDAQNGPDHVDSHRSDSYVISPYVKQGVINSKMYSTNSTLRTMELLLNAAPLTQYDAVANVYDIFDNAPNNIAPYNAILPSAAFVTEVLTSGSTYAKANPKEWNRLVNLEKTLNFADADANDPAIMNELVWKSVKGLGAKVPAPKVSKFIKARNKKAAKSATKSAAKTARKDDDD